ncbi:MAG: TIGR00266 family protein [Verrucomicrobiales bacterium]
MQTWYYLDSARQQLSAPESELPGLVARGVISPATMMWTQGAAGWLPASQALPRLFAGAGAPPPPPTGQRAHEIDFEVIGNEMQIVEIELDPGETVIAEAGGMNYMDAEIQFETKMGDGSAPTGGFGGILKTIGKRVLTGESLFMTHFTNRGAGKKKVAFGAPYPGKIIPMNLRDFGGEIVCQKDAFLCAAYGTAVGIAFNKKLGAGLFGGEGFIMQRLSGDGLAFVHAGGTIIKRELRGERLLVDTGCLVALTRGVNYDIERVGGLKSMVFGGEGLFFASLQGHGTIWLQSLPFSRLADRILASAPSGGGSSVGEGSVLGGLGRLLDGN